MKILVDACAWSLILRRRKSAVLNRNGQVIQKMLTEAIQNGRVVLIGPIRQEVLTGIRDAAHFEKLRYTLEAFPDEPLAPSHYEEAARLFNLCRNRGVECGSTDILICAVAIQRQLEILTYDQGLQRCIATLRAEGLSL